MLRIRHNEKVLLSRDLIIVSVSPVHTHELIITRNDKEFWNIFKCLFVKVSIWICDVHSHREGICVNVSCDVRVNIVVESEGEAIV